MTTPAETLNAAAEKLRTLAKDATPGPWESLDGGDRLVAWKVGPGGFDDDFDYVVDEPMSHEGNAAWIAAADPALAEPLAAWLESAVREHIEDEDTGVQWTDCPTAERALAVARVILGESS